MWLPGRLRAVGEPDFREGRVTTITRHVGLGDVGPDARSRLDGVARIVQDVSDYDASTVSIDGMGLWILRRLELRIATTPRFRAEVVAQTWCSGVGARWAERTSTLHVDGQPCVEAIAIWVHTDPERGAPTPLPPGFDAVWGATAGGRKVSARLRHAAPPAGAPRRPWPLRVTDIDVVGHVNNAAYWPAIEDELARRGGPRVRSATIEFRSGLDLSDAVDLVVTDGDADIASESGPGFAAWLCVGDDVRASVVVSVSS
jgi:acyl-ACP thioesterase